MGRQVVATRGQLAKAASSMLCRMNAAVLTSLGQDSERQARVVCAVMPSLWYNTYCDRLLSVGQTCWLMATPIGIVSYKAAAMH